MLAIDIILSAVFIFAVISLVHCLNTSAIDPKYEETMAALKEKSASLDNQLAAAKKSVEDRVVAANAQIEQLNADYEAAMPEYRTASIKKNALQVQYNELCETIDRINNYPEILQELRTTYGTAVRQLEDKITAGESNYKICYLTFDDGPSYYTNRFVNKLAKYNAYATFFTIGVEMDSSDYGLRDQYLRMEAMGGHSICNHSYSHKYYGSLYSSLSNFTADILKQDEVVYNATGLHTEIVRFPAGSHYCSFRTKAIESLHENGMKYVDWCGNCYDSGSVTHSAAYTASTILRQVRTMDIIVVLCHDWKLNTLEALDTVIPTLQDEGYLFLPLFKESSVLEENTTPKWDD